MPSGNASAFGTIVTYVPKTTDDYRENVPAIVVKQHDNESTHPTYTLGIFFPITTNNPKGFIYRVVVHGATVTTADTWH